MKRLIVVAAAVAALLSLGAGQAVAGNHSGPEALAKGTGSVTIPATASTPIIGCVFFAFGTCFGGQVGSTTTSTMTSEEFDFDAKAGPQTLTPLDPTDGPFGHMRVVYRQTGTVTVTPFGNCIPSALFPPCPVPSQTTLPESTADVTADVTCLQVVNNTAAIGGHVTRFAGSLTPTRGILFNGTDNTVAGQQPTADLFDSAFLTDAPQVCPPPSGGHSITSGDVYVDQS